MDAMDGQRESGRVTTDGPRAARHHSPAASAIVGLRGRRAIRRASSGSVIRTPASPATGDGRTPEPWSLAGHGDDPDEFNAEQRQVVPQGKTPDTIAGWKALVEGLLTNECCAFHRNMEISSRYAWMYNQQPARFKWAAMAAFASHHVRLILFPLRLDTDGTGYVDIPRSLDRRRFLLTEDVNTIRATNNAIFDDIFWVHLAYATADDGIERLRALLRAEPDYAAVLAGFESIDQGRRTLADGDGVGGGPARG